LKEIMSVCQYNTANKFELADFRGIGRLSMTKPFSSVFFWQS
jgi:hypothetical protein